MTEPADQPLLAEQSVATKKPAKKRTTKTPASTAKKATTTVKPKAKRTTKAKAASPESVTPELPMNAVPPAAPVPAPDPAPVPAPAPVAVTPAPAPVAPVVEDWRPSRAVPPAAAPAPSVAPVSAPAAPAPLPVDPSQPVVRPRPVYIPRHVARQMEEQARAAGIDPAPIPVAVSAEEAARMDLPRVEPSYRAERPPIQHVERQDRGERHDRHDRGGRHDRVDRNDRVDSIEYLQPEPPRAELPPPREDEIGEAEGIVEVSGKGFGFLRDPKRSFAQHPADVFVTPELCRAYNLRDGQWVKGQTRRGNRGSQLFKITSINGDDPEKSLHLPAFDELTVVSPNKFIRLETVPDRYTTRIIDMFCPIGKGQRGLIVAPPRTGKTTLLQHIADAVVKNHKDMNLIILLVDERPEEVTEIKRTVPTAEIMASSNDSDIKSHTRIAQLAIERAKRLVESGKDVFLLLDSITRVGRAFNNATGGGGRTMSGGIDSRALEIPRKIFAAARNTEEAGSLTIIATALIDTGSRMDELIFLEFKGTGNMELVLDRKISDQRIYPAIDIFQSGTRREELLLPEADLHKINVIRRGLAGHKPIEAIERLLFFVKKFPTNAQMLAGIPG
ncbi:MAG: transcription termination factor Rho [Chthoniobacter sp.]